MSPTWPRSFAARTTPTPGISCSVVAAPDAGTLRTTRAAKGLTLQQAADALNVWPTTLSRLERGLSHDNEFHHRYETWLNCQPPGPVQTPHRR